MSRNKDLDDLLNDVYFKIDTQRAIAKKYNRSEGYISQLAKKFRQLKYVPNVINERLTCYNCDSQTILEFHHEHITGQTIALVCKSCNLKIGPNELEPMTPSARTREKQYNGYYKLCKVLVKIFIEHNIKANIPQKQIEVLEEFLK